jgi:hypothetical protein
MKINWTKPDIKSELGEYFENEFTKKFFKTKGLVFTTNEDLISFLNTGILLDIDPKKFNSGNTVNMTLTKKEFDAELNEPEYKKSFDSMEEILLKQGTIILPAPIIVNFSGLFFGFAGNRRMNLAIKHGIPLKAWRVNVAEKASSIDNFLAGI